jgi:hypothetical protein
MRRAFADEDGLSRISSWPHHAIRPAQPNSLRSHFLCLRLRSSQRAWFFVRAVVFFLFLLLFLFVVLLLRTLTFLDLTPPHSCRFGFGGIPAASLSSLIIASSISFSTLPQLSNSILSSMAVISASVCPWSRISMRVWLNSRSIGCMSCKTNCLQVSSIKRGPFARVGRAQSIDSRK